MKLKGKTILCVLLACLIAVVISACTKEESGTTTVKDTRNNTVYDHSELAWYVQSRYGVEEADCQFYAFETSGQACLLARGKNNSGGNHYVLRMFASGVSSWYRYGSWIVESVSVSDIEQTYDDNNIELVEFVYGNAILHMLVASNSSGMIERLYILAGSDDYYNKEGDFFIWEYDRKGRAKGLFHSSGPFAEAFYGLDARGEFIKDYGDYSIFTYDSEGRLERVNYTSAKFSNNTLSEIQGSAGVGVGSLGFTYDIDGNRTAAIQDLSGTHEMVEYSRDASGKVVQATISESDLLGSGGELYRAKVTVTYRTDGSTEYSEPIVE